MKLGKQIKFIRRLVNMERKEVAELLDISQQQYNNIENDISNISEERLQELAKIFKVSEQTIKEIDIDKVYHQINNDNSTGNMGVIYQQNNELLKLILDNNSKLMEMMD